MSEKIEKQLAEIDVLIRSGAATKASQIITNLSNEKVQREYRLQLARLARRCGQYSLAIKLLNPIVRPGPKVVAIATGAEKAEYAANLTNLGANSEAMEILRSLNSKETPEVLLFRSFALIAEWNYSESIPLLKEYVQSKHISEYQRVVGNLNLAAAEVFEKDPGADNILTELRNKARKENLTLIYGNTLELSAQHAISMRKWKDAEEYLSLAQSTLQESNTVDHFFVQKWKAILEVSKTNGDKDALQSLKKIYEEAVLRKHWETARHCDLIWATQTQDKKRLHHLYIGTPFLSFRERIERELGGGVSLPDQYHWLPKGSKSHGIELDLVQGKTSNKKNSLKVGQIPHRLFCILASDFYRPVRLASIHMQLFPGEYFNPVSSPVRVHQIIKRLRAWIETEKLPLSILEDHGAYSLGARGNCSLIIPTKLEKDDSLKLVLAKIQEEMGNKSFGSSEMARIFGYTQRNARRILKKLEAEGKIKRLTEKTSVPQFVTSEQGVKKAA